MELLFHLPPLLILEPLPLEVHHFHSFVSQSVVMAARLLMGLAWMSGAMQSVTKLEFVIKNVLLQQYHLLLLPFLLSAERNAMPMVHAQRSIAPPQMVLVLLPQMLQSLLLPQYLLLLQSLLLLQNLSFVELIAQPLLVLVHA